MKYIRLTLNKYKRNTIFSIHDMQNNYNLFKKQIGKILILINTYDISNHYKFN